MCRSRRKQKELEAQERERKREEKLRRREQKQRDRELRRSQKQLEKLQAEAQRKLQEKIRLEERKLLLAQRNLQSLRLVTELLSRAKVPPAGGRGGGRKMRGPRRGPGKPGAWSRAVPPRSAAAELTGLSGAVRTALPVPPAAPAGGQAGNSREPGRGRGRTLLGARGAQAGRGVRRGATLTCCLVTVVISPREGAWRAR